MADDDDKVLNEDDEPVSTGDDDAGDLAPGADSDENGDGTQFGGHPIGGVRQEEESLPDEAQFEEPVAGPSVTGEEDVFSGDAPEGEPADIDAELAKVGLESDEDGPKPLSSDDIDY